MVRNQTTRRAGGGLRGTWSHCVASDHNLGSPKVSLREEATSWPPSERLRRSEPGVPPTWVLNDKSTDTVDQSSLKYLTDVFIIKNTLPNSALFINIPYMFALPSLL